MKTAESNIRAGLIAEGVPEHMHDGVIRYLLQGIPPGDFLEAALANDLMESMGRADENNREAMWNWCSWIYNCAPGNCHGSYEIVEKWCAARQAERKQEVQS